MRVCLILEGSYPYVFGGVSSWTNQYIKAMPDTEFVLWCIGAKAEDKGKFKFELPENVVEVHEVFLDDALRVQLDKKNRRKLKLTDAEKEEMKNLFSCSYLDWDVLFDLFQNKSANPVSLLMSEEFLEVLSNICITQFPYIPFVDFFHTIRSMMLPELYLLTKEVPKADIYHATATGYSGILASLAKWKYNKPMILTEHGIYTREREEELLRANWVPAEFKQMWIDLFYSFSNCAYVHADKVTCLFGRASKIQRELGCNRKKQLVIENGVHYERFCNIPEKKENGYIDIGAIVRIAKIKDIKTMIYAFAEVKSQVPCARLHILGDTDDKEYAKECKQLVEQLGIKDIIFTGVVNVVEYMEKLDFTILTSISEGQPLSVLESFAAGRCAITTDVGCCKELIHGEEGDGLGVAGICVPPMNRESLASAMTLLCKDKELRKGMETVAKQRVKTYYTHQISMDKYKKLYQEVL